MNGALRALDRIGSRPWFADAFVLGICASVIAASMFLSASPDAVGLWGYDVPVLCGMRRLTGIPCPGCGLTRSFVLLAHGQLGAAFSMNWLGPPLFVAVAAQVPWRIYLIARTRPAGAPSDLS